MKKNTKRLVVVVLALLLAVGIGVFYFVTQLDRIVADFIETEGSIATGTDVRVSGVSVKLANASATVSSISIGNPMQLDGNAFELGQFSIGIDTASLAGDVIVLDQVEVHGARLNVFQDGATNNLVHLQRNISRYSGEGNSENEGSDRRFIVRRFVLGDAVAHVSIPELQKEEQIDIPDIVLTNVGAASNGETGADIARQILTPIVEQALRVAADEYLQDQVDKQLEDAADSLLDSLKEQLEREPQPD